jgi:glycyl-tRNA synthetase beta chain
MAGPHEYFFEILLEEIPAWMLPHPTLEEKLREVYAAIGIDPASLAPGAIVVDATPRRLFFRLGGLPARQDDRREEVKGPPKKIAFAADGSPSQALAGFLRKNGAAPEAIVERGDEYVWLERRVEGKDVPAILAERIPPIIEGLRWPKTMRWSPEVVPYIRPAHSVVSIFDGALVPMQVLGADAGTTTRGHRILRNVGIEVDSYESYVERLRESEVTVAADDRVSQMRRLCGDLAREAGGEPATDDAIWDQWRYLTEAPGVIRSSFSESFLELPPEVLITVMRVHQKQLPVVASGKLTNHFLAVMDNVADPDGNVATGNAFVTNARFADALFFYETDRKRKLAERIGELSHLQFQEKLGNYLDKTHRIVAIASLIGDAFGGVSKEHLQTAAELAKVDLQTEMVKEFTELQGRVGGIYAREEGYADEVWEAIYDQYLPAGADDALPRGVTGSIVALADRIDTLAGFFLIGLAPTGSKDPFALRRAAQGVVQILLRDDMQVAIGVDRLVEIALEAYGDGFGDAAAARAGLLEFFAERVRTLLESRGLAYDEVAAAMEGGWANSLRDLRSRALAFRQVRDERDFLSLLDSAKRIANITAGLPSGTVDATLFAEPAEKRLGDLATLVGSQVDELVGEKRYVAALESFAGLAPDLEVFFDEVMVMVEDEAVKANRIALLRNVGSIVRKIGDVTRIVVDRKEYGRGR